MSCKFISFDQSTTITGYCTWIDGNFISSGCFNHKKIKESDLRFETMCYDIITFIKQEQPDVIAFEDTALQTNAKVLKDLSQLQGVIIGYCLSHNIKYFIYTPSKWRTLLNFNIGKGVKRKDLKVQAIQYVLDNYNLNASEDEAEAICIGAAVLSEY